MGGLPVPCTAVRNAMWPRRSTCMDQSKKTTPVHAQKQETQARISATAETPAEPASSSANNSYGTHLLNFSIRLQQPLPSGISFRFKDTERDFKLVVRDCALEMAHLLLQGSVQQCSLGVCKDRKDDEFVVHYVIYGVDVHRFSEHCSADAFVLRFDLQCVYEHSDSADEKAWALLREPHWLPAAGMGVTIKFSDLCPKVYTGTSYSEHGRLSAMFEDQVVAVDGMQWIRQASNGARIDGIADGGIDTNATNQSVLMLFSDRVLDGRIPEGKKKLASSTGYCRSHSERCQLVRQLCTNMGIACLIAPSEGEAYCAALNKCGKVDAVWTTDVVDAFMFGANKVLRAKDDGKSNQAVLCYKYPQTSAAAVVSSTGMAELVGCSEREVEDVLTFLATMVGTDFNEGLKSYGYKTSKSIQLWLYKAWQQHNRSMPFDSFVENVLSNQIRVNEDNKQQKTFMKHARGETEQAKECELFTDQLVSTFAIVRDQRHQAEQEAAKRTREEFLWDMKGIQHASFVSLLRKHQVSRDESKGKNPPELRVMNLEAERMLRSPEHSCEAATRIVSVSKTKDTWGDSAEAGVLDTDGVADSQRYQYLVDIALNPTFSGFNGPDDGLLQYLNDTIQKKPPGAWVAGARIARKSSLVKNWPTVLRDYTSKKAGKKQDDTARKAKAAVKAQQQQEKKLKQTQLRCLGSIGEKVTAPFKRQKPQTTQPCVAQQRTQTKGAGPSRGFSLADTSGSGAPASNEAPAPPRPRKINLFAALKTPQQDPESLPTSSALSHPLSHPLSPSQSPPQSPPRSQPAPAGLSDDSDLSDPQCETPRAKPSRLFDECDGIVGTHSSQQQIDLISPLKKRAVSPPGDSIHDRPSSVKSSDVIDLLASPGSNETLSLRAVNPVRLVQAAGLNITQRECIDLVDSDSD